MPRLLKSICLWYRKVNIFLYHCETRLKLSLKAIFLIFFLLFFCSICVFADETMTITTYYPSPYGSYQTLTTNLLVTNRVSAQASTTIDWSKGNVQSYTLSGNTTITLTNGTDGAKYILILKQPAGAATVTWSAGGGGVRWPGPGNVPPTLTAGGSSTDYIGFIYNNSSGTAYYDGIATSLDF
jgi:hypothetical protein